jgi:hypothetical protein
MFAIVCACLRLCVHVCDCVCMFAIVCAIVCACLRLCVHVCDCVCMFVSRTESQLEHVFDRSV